MRPGRRTVHVDRARDGPAGADRGRARPARRSAWPRSSTSSWSGCRRRRMPVPWSELQKSRPPWMTVRAPSPAGRHAELRGIMRGPACTRSARRPAARTSASAGAAARRRSRSSATSARAPAATAPSRRARPRRPRAAGAAPVAGPSSGWASATSSSRRSTATTSPTAARATSRQTIRAIRRAQPGLRRRGARARLPRLPRGGPPDRARGRARRLQPQHRDVPSGSSRRVRPKGDYERALRAARHAPRRSGPSCIPSRPRCSRRAGSSSAWARPTRRCSR